MTSENTKSQQIKLFALILLLTLTFLCCSKSENEPKSEISNPKQQGSEVLNNPEAEGGENTGTVNSDLSDITSGFESLSSFYGFEGAQVAITRNGKLVYLESFGKADTGENEIVSSKSLFRIASISKPITLVAISKLVSENKLSLNEKVFGPNSILGSVYGTPPYEPSEESITVLQLLEHRAGFANIPNDIMFTDLALSHTNLIGKVLDERSLSNTPGEQYEYSNFGYSLLGRIIEKRTGMTYEEYVQNEILSPMTITDMNIAGNTKSEKFENEVSYYSNWSSPYEMNVTRMDSHGGWVASAISLAKFAIRVDGDNSVSDFLGPNERLVYMTGRSWGHDGALPGTTAVLSVGYPTSYVVLLNKGNANFVATTRIIREFMDGKIKDRNQWPSENLFELQ